MAMRAGAATVHELSGGRMMLGLGASHRDTVSGVRGHDYPGPLTAMREYVDAYEAADTAVRGRRPTAARSGCPSAPHAGTRRPPDRGGFPYLVPASYVTGPAGLDEAALQRTGRAPCSSSACHACGRPMPMTARATAAATWIATWGCRTT